MSTGKAKAPAAQAYEFPGKRQKSALISIGFILRIEIRDSSLILAAIATLKAQRWHEGGLLRVRGAGRAKARLAML